MILACSSLELQSMIASSPNPLVGTHGLICKLWTIHIKSEMGVGHLLYWMFPNWPSKNWACEFKQWTSDIAVLTGTHQECTEIIVKSCRWATHETFSEQCYPVRQLHAPISLQQCCLSSFPQCSMSHSPSSIFFSHCWMLTHHVLPRILQYWCTRWLNQCDQQV